MNCEVKDCQKEANVKVKLFKGSKTLGILTRYTLKQFNFCEDHGQKAEWDLMSFQMNAK
jgi:hypothetical protein